MSLKRLLVLAPIVALSSCYYREHFYKDVVVRESGKFEYEVQLRKHVEGRGNVHAPSMRKFEYDDAAWLYVNAIAGRIDASSLVFTKYWACLEYPWSTQKLKGYVEFKDGQLVVALQAPWYEDGKTSSGYRPLEINGTYSVRTEQAPYRPTETDLRYAPCDRTGVAHER